MEMCYSESSLCLCVVSGQAVILCVLPLSGDRAVEPVESDVFERYDRELVSPWS